MALVECKKNYRTFQNILDIFISIISLVFRSICSFITRFFSASKSIRFRPLSFQKLNFRKYLHVSPNTHAKLLKYSFMFLLYRILTFFLKKKEKNLHFFNRTGGRVDLLSASADAYINKSFLKCFLSQMLQKERFKYELNHFLEDP